MAVVVSYPCSQFDYIASGRTESETQELFEAWTAAHHPALFEMDATMPRWETASYPPFNLQQDIVIIPPCCESFWNDDWTKKTADCTLIRNTIHRDEIVQQILAARNCPESHFDEDFVQDCYALAVARLWIALLNRNRYYLSKPDESRLKSLMTDAIQAVRNNEPEAQKQAIQGAFDEIAMAKDKTQPSQIHYLELILAAPTTVGEPLRQLLEEAEHINLFMPSGVLETLPETYPDTFSQLKLAVEQNKVRFIADDTEPQSLTLLPILDVADRILEGGSVYRELLNVSPKIYGRLTPGLSPVMPQLLKSAEFSGVIHFAPLAGWRIKEKVQSKIVWQGVDSTSIDALVRYPIDATTFIGFFDLAEQLCSQMSQDSVPTGVFALFPGQKSSWIPLLRRMSRFSSGLGKFEEIEEYFRNTVHSGSFQRFGYEIYPVNALMECDQNPLSHWNELYRKNTDRLVQSSLEMLVKLLKRSTATPSEDESFGRVQLVQQFMEAVLPAPSSTPSPGEEGTLVVNPLSFSRRMFVNDIAVDVPPLGYAFVEGTSSSEDGSNSSPTLLGRFFKTKNTPVLARTAADDIGRGEKRKVFILENRYFSAKFDALSGTLRSIFTNRSRFNQLSRQIAFRKDQTYSIQAADEIIIAKATAEVGQLKMTGRLVTPDGEVAARFTETVTIRSQSRLLKFDVTLEPVMEMDDDRWNSYIAVRYAWNDDALNMCGGLNDGLHELPDRSHLHSPKFIDLRSATESLTFFTEGLPFHRRSGNRQLDTLLMVKGELQRQFRLGIAVNAKNPVQLSYDFLLGQDGWAFPVSCRPKTPSAWLFQIESNNVMALYWEPAWEGDTLIGYMVYLQEVGGRRAHFALRSFVPPQHAAAMNFQGKELKTLKVDADAVLIDMHIYELLPLMVRIV
ncbi:MAG: hypothetical protein LBI05_00625 [Planctomycetaceae bacterium]|jgi:hypothetical protein|nr:hypothetical protein [Planctomycetaceae bacterium]